MRAFVVGTLDGRHSIIQARSRSYIRYVDYAGITAQDLSAVSPSLVDVNRITALNRYR